MRIATYLGGIAGLALFVASCIHADFFAMLHILQTAGWPVLWLLPFRASFFLLYAAGWWILLRPSDAPGHASLGYLFWVTTVREAIDRLLPVASVGGGVIGVRLVRWRGLAAAPVGASVIMEVVLTLIVSYVFTALGLLLSMDTGSSPGYGAIVVLTLSIPIPIAIVLLLRH